MATKKAPGKSCRCLTFVLAAGKISSLEAPTGVEPVIHPCRECVLPFDHGAFDFERTFPVHSPIDNRFPIRDNFGNRNFLKPSKTNVLGGFQTSPIETQDIVHVKWNGYDMKAGGLL